MKKILFYSFCFVAICAIEYVALFITGQNLHTQPVPMPLILGTNAIMMTAVFALLSLFGQGPDI